MIRVGKIVAAHGLGGDLILTHVTGKKDWLKAGDVLFVALRKGSHIPHFISRIKSASQEEMILHLEEAESVEAAKKLVGKEIFVQDDMLAKAKLDTPLMWIGFEAIDVGEGSLGLIEDIYQTAQQWLATVRIDGKEALLPLIEQTVKKVDIKSKKLYLELPEGLLDVYR